MCVKAVNTCPFKFDSILDGYKTQEMCDKFASNDLFVLKYCLDRDTRLKNCLRWRFFTNIKTSYK